MNTPTTKATSSNCVEESQNEQILESADFNFIIAKAILEKAEQFIQAHKDNSTFLKVCLKPCEEFIQLSLSIAHSVPSWFGFPIKLILNCLVS